MNLIHGRMVENSRIGDALSTLEKDIADTLAKPLLDISKVVDACEKLASGLPDELVLPVLAGLGMEEKEARGRLDALRFEFSRDYLLARLEQELGPSYGKAINRTPRGLGKKVTEQFYPLGVLFHIAAGNMDGLPVYSVIEGLLGGNINLLKLPAVDGGLSIMILQRLFAIEPLLAEYVYVFEMSSAETDSMLQLARLANAVVVWGGDEAVQSVRRMAPPNTKIIEWGHKLSFAYVTKQGMAQAALEGLAHNICATNQLLCSSCQGVFVDTEDLAEAEDFCRTFLPVLETVAKAYPPVPLAFRAQSTLQLYSRGLENIYGEDARVFRGQRASIQLEPDSTLAPSLQHRNIWVRRLLNHRLVQTLYPYKSYLQTAALLCGPRQWNPLRDKLWQAGVVRVSAGAEMSESYCGAAHDGTYPLRQYTRVVSAQK